MLPAHITYQPYRVHHNKCIGFSSPSKLDVNIAILLCTSLSYIDSVLEAHLNGQVHKGKYLFTAHLAALDSCRPSGITKSHVQLEDLKPHSPLIVRTWSDLLSGHPDQDYVCYILKGITKG